MSMGPERKIRVLIVDDVADTRENIKKLLLFESDIDVIGAAADGAQAIEAARQLKPDVVLMDINMPGMDGIAAAEAIGVQVPHSQVVMMSVQAEADYLRRSMLAGAREFLIKPFTGDELVEGIRRVYKLGAMRREAAVQMQQPAAPVQPAMPVAPPQEGKIIAVFSPKGGAGRTTIATNLAVALKAETGKRVALVDASLQFGDVGVLLNLEQKKSIADLISSNGEVDMDLLDAVLQTHPSGLRVLLAPSRPEMAEIVSIDSLKKILSRLRASHDFVVVDTWTSFHDQILAVLDLSDRILLLMNSEMTTVKNVRLFLEVAEALGYPSEKMVLVVNRVDSRGGISVQDIQRSISHPIAATVVNDYQTAVAAVNRGVPFVIGQRDSQISRNMRDLAHLIAGWTTGARPKVNGAAASAQAARKKGLLQWLLGR